MTKMKFIAALFFFSAMFAGVEAASKSDIHNAKGKNAQNAGVELHTFLTGKEYVLVDFWASWCPPCKASMPKLVEAYANYKGKGLEIVGICVRDEYPKYVKAVADHQMTWPTFLDETAANKAFALKGVPTFILFSPSNEVLYNGHNVVEAIATFEKEAKISPSKAK